MRSDRGSTAARSRVVSIPLASSNNRPQARLGAAGTVDRYSRNARKETDMLAVTDAAKDVLGQILANSEAAQEQSLRLTRSAGDEFGLALDQQRSDDQIVSNGDQTVLLVEHSLADELQGVMLDASQMPEGPSLRMVHSDQPYGQNGAGPH
jgi:hypothetical protein